MNRRRFEPAPSPGPGAAASVALMPAGGELWEDFLDTINVPLARFCSEGPGGWILGFMKALRQCGLRTVLVLVSGRVDRPTRYCEPGTGDAILIFPAPWAYPRLRGLGPRYVDLLAGRVPKGALARIRTLFGAALSHLSTPVGAIAQALRQENCRALIAQEYDYFRLDHAVLIGSRLGVPVFASFQGSRTEVNPFSRAWKRRTIRRARLLIGPSEEIARVRAAYSDDARVTQVFNPVDLAGWHAHDRARARASLGATEQTRIVVWHGRIAIESKGLDMLLEAWRHILAERPGQDLRLRLMGTGEDAAAFRAAIAAFPPHSVTWIDRYETDPEAIRIFLAAGDVYVFPSRLEGLAVAPLEAMACGLPVVAAAASGVRDVLACEEDGGLVVPVGDAAAFAEGLGRFLDDPALARAASARARHRIEEVFSVDAVSRQLAAALAAEAVHA